MSLAPVDVLEEDAADLQFPKDPNMFAVAPTAFTKQRIRHYKPIDAATTCSIFSQNCCACSASVKEPYIQCVDCPQLFCPECFANGRETAEHRNNHSYTIRHNNHRVFAGSSWTAGEEKQLLDAILCNGVANWEETAKTMKTRSALECRLHYEQNYFDGIFEKMLGLTSEPYFREHIPYMYKMNSVDPPRQEMDPAGLAGYRCARGEFDVPFDNSAEIIVSNLNLKWQPESEWGDIGEALNCAMFRTYNHRLRERQRRYRIMRDHGLLMTSRTLSWLSKHSEALGCCQSGKLGAAGRFISFMQLAEPVAFDMLVEAMQYAHDLRKYVFRLYELRKNGILTFHGGRVFHKCRARRMSKIRNKREDHYENTWEWKQLVPNYDGGSNTGGPGVIGSNLMGPQFMGNLATKRKSTPLEILGLPGYDKLTEDEKELCSTVRLVPMSYIGYKTILTAENTKTGYLRLADARRLIKIDVNKTRQLYDFLLKSGFIDKPFN